MRNRRKKNRTPWLRKLYPIVIVYVRGNGKPYSQKIVDIADVAEILFMSQGTHKPTLCWFSMSLNCLVKAVNDGLAFGSFCQHFVMI